MRSEFFKELEFAGAPNGLGDRLTTRFARHYGIEPAEQGGNEAGETPMTPLQGAYPHPDPQHHVRGVISTPG
jgi:hypothetical protein